MRAALLALVLIGFALPVEAAAMDGRQLSLVWTLPFVGILLSIALLSIGTVLASFMGTTGASMPLIRPVLRANQHRSRKVHTFIFFIFLVFNIGGSLTPIGDPPLYLVFLKGISFF